MKNGKDLKLNNILVKYLLIVVTFCVTTIFFYDTVEARYRWVRDNDETISFVGDIYQKAANVKKAYNREGGINNVVHSSYKKILNNSDYVMGNLECCISNETESFDKQFTFRVDPLYKNIIKEAGIDLVTVANNHSLDFGKKALKDTLKNLEDTGVSYVGVGDDEKKAREPFVKEINGRRYVIYAASAVAPTHEWFAIKDSFGINNGYNSEAVCNEIRKRRKKEPDSIIIIYMHWGEEKEEFPSKMQREYAMKMVDAGCDLILGSHPHVFQNIEYYKNVPIIYSLGNFIYGDTSTDTMVLDATFDFSVDGEKRIYLKINPGTSGFERVVLLGYKKERDEKVQELMTKCPMCKIDEYGYIIENKIEE
ncbi:MAG: CapA family protein [Lachnospiraceae bacterium]|nr:CapA family protein [Lachnospiraceae bacterium]